MKSCERDPRPATTVRALADTARAARLKAALKANIARRKAQAKAREADARPDLAEEARDD